MNDPQTAIQTLISESISQRLFARGLNEACRNIEQRQATLCLLANNCDNSEYLKTVEGLCKESSPPVPIIKVDSNEDLGKWAGLCRYDSEGNPKKIVKCSCFLIKSWPKDSEAVSFIKNMLAEAGQLPS